MEPAQVDDLRDFEAVGVRSGSAGVGAGNVGKFDHGVGREPMVHAEHAQHRIQAGPRKDSNRGHQEDAADRGGGRGAQDAGPDASGKALLRPARLRRLPEPARENDERSQPQDAPNPGGPAGPAAQRVEHEDDQDPRGLDGEEEDRPPKGGRRPPQAAHAREEGDFRQRRPEHENRQEGAGPTGELADPVDEPDRRRRRRGEGERGDPAEEFQNEFAFHCVFPFFAELADFA